MYLYSWATRAAQQESNPMPREDGIDSGSRESAWWALLRCALLRALGPNRVVVLRGCRCNWNWAREEGTGQDRITPKRSSKGKWASGVVGSDALNFPARPGSSADWSWGAKLTAGPAGGLRMQGAAKLWFARIWRRRGLSLRGCWTVCVVLGTLAGCCGMWRERGTAVEFLNARPFYTWVGMVKSERLKRKTTATGIVVDCPIALLRTWQFLMLNGAAVA